MGCVGDVFNVLWTLCSSIFDVGSDFINSLDFLGYKVSTTIASSIVGYSNDTEAFAVHQIWGYVGLGIIWLPGFICLPYFTLWALSEKSWFFLILGLILFVAYPLVMLVVELGFLIHTCYKRDMNKEANPDVMYFLFCLLSTSPSTRD